MCVCVSVSVRVRFVERGREVVREDGIWTGCVGRSESLNVALCVRFCVSVYM